MQDDLRQQLIRQFSAEVIEMTDEKGKDCYVCPTCKRAITVGTDKCAGCSQVLSWDYIRRVEDSKGLKKVVLEFEVPADFAKGDCRKCPLSYIGKDHNQSVYECPLKMRADCKLKMS